ncbi:MAG: signal peptidase II [Chitinophagales bacterium]|jgi:signal peptidase II
MKHIKWLWLSLVIIVADQATKYWAEHILGWDGLIPILPIFDFSLVHNTGSAFGFLGSMGGWQQIFFVTLAAVMSIVLTIAITRLQSFERHLAVAYCLVVAGAIGNAIDRFIYQYVVDFIHWFYQDYHFPHFNIADISIFIGAALLIAEAFGKPFLNTKH